MRTRPTPRRLRGWAGVALVMALAACAPELPPEPRSDLTDLSGEWSYTATDLRLEGLDAGSSCTVQGMTLMVDRWEAAGLTGSGSGGEFTCTGALAILSGPLGHYLIGGGGMVEQYVAFELNGRDWRNDGVLSADTIQGTVRLFNGQAEFNGRFRAVRKTRP